MRITAALALLLLLCACGPYGDGAYASRQAERERKVRLGELKAATAEQPSGRFVASTDLAPLVSGRTHVFEYVSDPQGNKNRYVEYQFFRPDGRFVFMNTTYMKDPEGKPEDHWRVDGDRLCIVNTYLTQEERCFRLAVLPNGRIQYYISSPGTEWDKLLTKVTDQVLEGAPKL